MEMGGCGGAAFIRIAKSRKHEPRQGRSAGKRDGAPFQNGAPVHHGKTTRVEGLWVPPTHNLSQMEVLLMDETQRASQRRRPGHRAQRGEAMRMRWRRSLGFSGKQLNSRWTHGNIALDDSLDANLTLDSKFSPQLYNEQFIIICITCIQRNTAEQK